MFQFNSFFLECVAKSDRLGKELRIAEENLKKDLRGKNKVVLFFEIDLIKLNEIVQQRQMIWKLQKQIWRQRERN